MSSETRIRINTGLLIFGLTCGAGLIAERAASWNRLANIERVLLSMESDHDTLTKHTAEIANLNAKVNQLKR